jgi:HK97 family phage major capsid protein
MPTGIDEKLLPTAVSSRVIESAIKQSVVLQLATTQPMPAFIEQVPVVTTAPSASWVSARARKPIAQVDWSAATVQAEEIAAVTSIPDAYIADTSGSWAVEASAEAELAKAIARALDAAVLFGTNAPSSYPAGGIAAIAGAALTGDDALEAIDAALTAIGRTGCWRPASRRAPRSGPPCERRTGKRRRCPARRRRAKSTASPWR